jgi:DNA-binding transcriptional regulator GbsR (MarR family)
MDDGSSMIDPIKQEFINDVGQYFDSYGVSDIMGRIFGLLLFAAKPLSLTEIAKELQISKAAVSINIRTLKLSGLVQKATIPGDRRDYYCLDSEYGHGLFSRTIKKIDDGLEMLHRTLNKVNGIQSPNTNTARDMETVGKHLAALIELYELHNQMISELLQRWSAKNSKNTQ